MSLATGHTVQPPIWLPQEASDLSGLSLECLRSQVTQSNLSASPSREPSDLSGLEPDDPPWVAFGHCSCSPATPPDWLENHLTWAHSVLVVPLGLHAVCPREFPLSFICRTIPDYYTLWASFVYCFIVRQLFIYSVLEWQFCTILLLLLNCVIINSVEFCFIWFHCISVNYCFITAWKLFDYCLITVPIIVRYSGPER